MPETTESRITGTTRILGLIADPIAHARSPAMMTEILRERGQFGAFVLLPMETPASALGQVVDGLRRIENFAGAIVSMPHKTAIVSLLDELTPDARMVGAVNVVRRAPDGRLHGTILDGEGFVSGYEATGRRIDGRSVLLVGAGGAAAAIAFALAAHGCGVLTLTNRTAAKATALAARVAAAFPEVEIRFDDAAGRRYDLAVNATSLGMHDGDPLPMSDDLLRRAKTIAECVVTTEVTPLLARARDLGCAIHTGVPMLRSQMDLMLRFMGVE
jgi:shikimate dehydrogenase